MEFDFIKLRRGQVVEGEVVQVTDQEVAVDINYVTEGIIYKSAIDIKDVTSCKDVVKVGDVIKAIVNKVDDEEVLLSRRAVLLNDAMKGVKELYKERTPVTVKVKEENSGGFIVELGKLHAFLPKSEVFMKNDEDIRDLVGKEIEVQIIDFYEPKHKIVVSHRKVENKKYYEQRESEFEAIEIGQTIEVEVVRVFDKYAFVKYGAVNGSIRIGNVSHHRIEKIEDKLSLGDVITVKVINKSEDGKKIEVSLRAVLPTPFEEFADSVETNSVLDGKIVKVFDFGILVELAPKVSGLVHRSEYSWNPNYELTEDIAEGKDVKVKLISVDKDKERIALSFKRLENDPWQDIDYTVGQIVPVEVTKFVARGAIVQLGLVQAFLPTNQISSEKRFANASDALALEQKIDVFITNVDKAKRKIDVSIRRIKEEEERKEFDAFLDENAENYEETTLADVYGDKLKDLIK